MNAPPPPEHIDACMKLELDILALIERHVAGRPDSDEVGITAANGAVIALWIRLVHRAGCPRHKIASEVIRAIRDTPWEGAVDADVRAEMKAGKL